MTVLLPALLLAAVGVAMVYAATFNKAGMPILHLKQIVWLSLALLAMLFFASLNYQVLIDRYAFPAYWALVVLLAFLLAAGQEIAGSRRWLSLGPFGIQPSEFAKLATVLVLAKFLAARHDRTHEWGTFWGALGLAGLPMLLILREPDLGTALVFLPMVLILLFAHGVPFRRLLGTVGVGLLASPLVWLLLKDYQRRRLLVFLNPASDMLGAGYNVIQSKIAIGSGMFAGKGWLSGTQGQLRFVPEHHTDFIFSVLAEEWGFIGAAVVVLLFILLLLQALRVARSARDLEGSLTAIGLTTMLFTQVAINLSVAMGMMPVTGMTLPLISYGGSSLIAVFSLLGILNSIWTGRTVK